MLLVNNLKIEILTNKNKMGFNSNFKNGLNIVCSDNNTSGKSSVISAIYYALGMEEIIGGRGYNVLSSAFKTKIQFQEEELDVIESKVFLEISNGSQIVTLFRCGKSTSQHHNLITVFHSELKDIYSLETIKEDMYVHFPNSATNKRGFFTFLEEFLGLSLPFVPTKNDVERKLYLQLIFSCMLIEQKRGWSDLFSGMPYFDIREQKKRVIEYILDLETLKNEKLKYTLNTIEKKLKEKWFDLYTKYTEKLKPYNFEFQGISKDIHILEENSLNVITIDDGKTYSIESYKEKLQIELNNIVSLKKKPKENFVQLQKELQAIKSDLSNMESKLKETELVLRKEETGLENLQNSLELINTDIINNKDAQRLQKLGSTENFNVFKHRCPTCEQKIEDTVLISQNSNPVMSIDENIKHLESQKDLFMFAIKQKEETISQLADDINAYNNSINKLYFLLNITQNDLYSPDDSFSETAVYKKVELQKTIYELSKLEENITDVENQFLLLSNDWRENQADKLKLPKEKLTELDADKLKNLRTHFMNNLKAFGYRSSLDISQVQISKDTYMPMIENFDMKFDSSASDHIRRIWAFTIALLQTSNDLKGHHPGILIFDEPGQHSIVVDDMLEFFNVLNKLQINNQVIVGITIKETDTKNLVLQEISNGAHGIILNDRAFQEID